MAKNPIKIENYKVGMILGAASARVSAEKTTPPPYFTEASLMDAMREAWRFVDAEQDRAMLKETNGIGTARTRGDVIKDLLRGKLIARDGKGKKTVLKVTPTGRALTSIAPAALKSIGMTAKWEMLFAQIEKGEILPDQFRAVIKKFQVAIVEHARKQKLSGSNNLEPRQAK